MTSSDVKKFNYMENVLLKINQKFISLAEADVKCNNAILKAILDEIISRLKKQDRLFEKLYQKIFFGGSFYDGLKINNPEEYDLDIILNLPKILEVKLKCREKDGYVSVAAEEFEKFKKSEEALKYPKIEKLICDQKYFSTRNVRSWMEGILSKVLNDLDNHEIIVNVFGQTLKPNIVHVQKSGPAFTLTVKTELNGKHIAMNIDLVTCFLMTEDKWPKEYVRNPVPEKNTFFVVPKQPYVSSDNDEKYWRLSFPEQERELLKGKSYKALKPSAKLVKQLRNSLDHKSICSYFIKTVFLWELRKQEGLWMTAPLSFVFMTMLGRYKEYLKKGEIPYYWFPKYNLIRHINNATLEGFGNKVSNIIVTVEQTCDPFKIASYLLPTADVEQLKQEVDIGKRHIKKQQSVIAPQKTMSSDLNTHTLPKIESQNSEEFAALLKDPEFLKSAIKVYENRMTKNPVVSDCDTSDSIQNDDQIVTTNDLIAFDTADETLFDSIDIESQVDVTDGIACSIDKIESNIESDYIDSAICSNSLDDISSTQNDTENHKCCVHLRNDIANIREELHHLRKVTDTILREMTTKSYPKIEVQKNKCNCAQKTSLTSVDKIGFNLDSSKILADIIEPFGNISLAKNEQAQKKVSDSLFADLL